MAFIPKFAHTISEWPEPLLIVIRPDDNENVILSLSRVLVVTSSEISLEQGLPLLR